MDSAKRASAPRTHILDRQIVAAGKGGKPAEVSNTNEGSPRGLIAKRGYMGWQVDGRRFLVGATYRGMVT